MPDTSPIERTEAATRFHPLFERWARRVRARVALRHALTASALAKGDARRVRPRLLLAVHLAAPLAIAGLVFIARAPLPPAPIVAKAPGTTKVQLKDVEGLKKVAELGQVQARDEEQKKRLEQIAKDADKLREDLEKGLEKREAQDR